MTRRIAFAMLLLFATCAIRAQGNGCSLTLTNMSFGTYTGALLNGTATGVVKCNGAWDIPMNAGMGVGATETVREMTGPNGAEISYQIFQDAARTINWGNTSSTDLNGTGNADITVYGQIPAGQSPAPGTYTDTVDTATTSFNISVVVSAYCSISATALAFGTYSGSQVNSTSTITATCTNTTPYNVGLNAGTASGATVTTRKMTGPNSALLKYSLYSNSGRTTNWGNTVGTDTVAGTGSGGAQTLTVYGQLPAGQVVTPGSYADTITATLTY